VFDIEPFYNWRDHYRADEDERSPFYGAVSPDEAVINRLYDQLLHPEWDAFGAATLYAKVLMADYRRGYAVIEFIGEWNDAVHNDVMFLKRDVIDPMLAEGIRRFILLGENVLNFHADADDYYAEWYEEVAEDGGWIAALNFREHVREEMEVAGIPRYFLMNREFIAWRTFTPWALAERVDAAVTRRLGTAEEEA
jgi:hypothetical protein